MEKHYGFLRKLDLVVPVQINHTAIWTRRIYTITWKTSCYPSITTHPPAGGPPSGARAGMADVCPRFTAEQLAAEYYERLYRE